jgi:hypothetical protein
LSSPRLARAARPDSGSRKLAGRFFDDCWTIC